MNPEPKAKGALAGLPQKALALLFAFVGGWGADLAGVPLGWMIGSMFTIGVLSVAGLEFKVPGLVRWTVLAVLGVYLGASFSPEVIRWLPRAGVSVVGMFITVMVEVAIATFVMMRVMRCSFITSYAACMPGGFSSMTLIAQEHGGDVEVVSIVQLVRVVVVLSAISLAARYFGVETQGSVASGDYAVNVDDLLLALSVTLVGLGTGIFFKIPVFCMLCPMLIAAVSQTFGFTDLSLPEGPLAVALAILGAAVGAHWGNLRSKRVLGLLLCGLVLAVFLLAFSAGAAWLVARTIFLDLAPTLLAYSPGGVSEISLIAVALDIEPALVGMHHVLRVLFIFLTLPVVLHVVETRIRMARQKEG